MKKAFRIGGLILAFTLVIAAMFFSVTYRPTVTVEVWNKALTKGSDSGKPFIMYTDLACPYCLKFAEAVNSHKDDFNKRYIDSGKVRFEVRVTDYLYDNGSENSKTGGESVYCAARQDKFWPYYEALTHKLYVDYYSHEVSAPQLESEYYIDIAKEVGLDTDMFTECLQMHDAEDELTKATNKAQAAGISGMPSFAFNGTSWPSGFDGTWDMDHNYELAKKMIDAKL